jgi:hypothetical protein
MTFEATMLGILAREHQRELIEAAAERRLIRESRAAHPSRWRRRRPAA